MYTNLNRGGLTVRVVLWVSECRMVKVCARTYPSLVRKTNAAARNVEEVWSSFFKLPELLGLQQARKRMPVSPFDDYGELYNFYQLTHITHNTQATIVRSISRMSSKFVCRVREMRVPYIYMQNVIYDIWILGALIA